MVTWGDGVSDIDLDRLLAFHRSHGKLATITAVRPPARFGHLGFDGDKITNERVYLDAATLVVQIGRPELLSLLGGA